jgi:hypothetical protein
MDPDDTPGQFDIRKTQMAHPDRVVFQTRVTGELQKSDFAGGNFFFWSIETRGGDQLDFTVALERIRRNGRARMKCAVIRHADKPVVVDRFGGRLDGHTGICRIPQNKIDGVPREWNASTLYGENFDAAPDIGRYPH